MITCFFLWYPSFECPSFHHTPSDAKRPLGIYVVILTELLSTYVVPVFERLANTWTYL